VGFLLRVVRIFSAYHCEHFYRISGALTFVAYGFTSSGSNIYMMCNVGLNAAQSHRNATEFVI